VQNCPSLDAPRALFLLRRTLPLSSLLLVLTARKKGEKKKGKRRQGKGRQGKGREGKARQGKARQGKGRQ